MKKSLNEMMEALVNNGIEVEKFNININIEVKTDKGESEQVVIEEPKAEKVEPETKEVETGKRELISKKYLKTKKPTDSIAIATIRSTNGMYYDREKRIWRKGINGIYKTMTDKDFNDFVEWIDVNEDIVKGLNGDNVLYGTEKDREGLEMQYGSGRVSDDFKEAMACVTLNWLVSNTKKSLANKAEAILISHEDGEEEGWKLYANLKALIEEEGLNVES